jgi:hypothetical protein
VGDTNDDPTDHSRTTQPHAGPAAVLIAVLGAVAGSLWLVMEGRRVTRIDAQWDARQSNGRPSTR